MYNSLKLNLHWKSSGMVCFYHNEQMIIMNKWTNEFNPLCSVVCCGTASLDASELSVEAC